MAQAGQIRAGIGGWTFEPWRGVFYPQGLKHAGMIHENVDQRLAFDRNGLARAVCPVVTRMQFLELVHCGVELEKGPAAHGPVLLLAGAAIVSMPGMFQTSAPAAA